MQRMHTRFVTLFVTIENKRLVNPTPKLKVARLEITTGRHILLAYLLSAPPSRLRSSRKRFATFDRASPKKQVGAKEEQY